MTTRRSSSGSNAMLVVGTYHALTQAAPCCSSLRTWAWGWGRGWGHGFGARLLQLPARHPFVARDKRQRGHEREKHPVDAGQEGGGETRPRVGRVVAESEEEEARLGVAGTRARQTSTWQTAAADAQAISHSQTRLAPETGGSSAGKRTGAPRIGGSWGGSYPGREDSREAARGAAGEAYQQANAQLQGCYLVHPD